MLLLPLKYIISPNLIIFFYTTLYQVIYFYNLVILLVKHGCDFGWGWLGKKVATEKLPPQEEAIGLETPAFDRLLPRRVSIRAKKLCPKIRSQSVRRASWRDFFFWNYGGTMRLYA